MKTHQIRSQQFDFLSQRGTYIILSRHFFLMFVQYNGIYVRGITAISPVRKPLAQLSMKEAFLDVHTVSAREHKAMKSLLECGGFNCVTVGPFEVNFAISPVAESQNLVNNAVNRCLTSHHIAEQRNERRDETVKRQSEIWLIRNSHLALLEYVPV